MPDWPATTWIAIYAAIVSTVALAWNIVRELWVERTRLRITAGIRDLVVLGRGSIKQDLLYIDVTNVGQTPASVAGIGGKFADEKEKKFVILVQRNQLPKKLERGEQMQETSEDPTVFKRRIAYLECWDTQGRHYRIKRAAMKKLREEIEKVKQRQ